jgi:hypothetical protein
MFVCSGLGAMPTAAVSMFFQERQRYGRNRGLYGRKKHAHDNRGYDV